MLEGVNVALGVTGSIAAVKTVELAHELRRHGASVRAVMTQSAQGIIHPWSLEYATQQPVVTEITGKVEHVELCGYDGWADVLLIAPGTANSVGKIANAVDDTPVTTCATTALGSGIPVVIAPAMHEPMYDHPGVLEAIEKVESWGVHFVSPRIEEGKAKIATKDTIALALARHVTPSPLSGKRVVVTSGGTSEAVDPVRVIANRSSGKTGRSVARALYTKGADVTLVHDGPDVPYADIVRVETAAEMLDAVMDAAETADALISVAAISDYTVETSDEKIRSKQDDLSLSLVPTPKLIDSVRKAHPDLTIVGFKAESDGTDDALIEKAREILTRADLSFVVANDASVMGQDETRALIVREHSARVFEGEKTALGVCVAEELETEL
ncbi:bifunctional phosphopantothenoylcysteine decarboxylase/phosphopantothenate--cysteine ligase CoaBC [Haladaptatus sp. ZSTT2]|uniref:bifunctional phosphopantothenoylcysteine decarboxylase/phosphopantothenate--cysteine ligase CoaBC n=1 Tax=Haladaptatus sp. ZSTT2 TaxID=3120515 RepID=UPI00300EB2B4